MPTHVGACQHSPLSSQRWFVHTWKKVEPAVQHRVPYSCNSWRCNVCRRHEAAVTFARLKQAQAPLDPLGWCYLVLTLDRDGYFSGDPWANEEEAYRALGKLTSATLKRIGRQWGPESRLERSGRSKQLRTVRYLGNRWVSVVEAHRSGWPHINLYVWCPELAAKLRREQAERLEDPEIANAVALRKNAWANKEPLQPMDRELARKATLVGGELRELLEDVGWGRQSTAEAADSIEAALAYGVKLCGMTDAAWGEIAKITQAPTNAPIRFRRLRSGKGFLPPRVTDETTTGCMVRRRRSAEGDWEIVRMNPPKNPDDEPAIEQAVHTERRLIEDEENELARNGALAPRRPITTTVRGQRSRDVRQLARELAPFFAADTGDALARSRRAPDTLQRAPSRRASVCPEVRSRSA
jgi:hypothetical protein